MKRYADSVFRYLNFLLVPWALSTPSGAHATDYYFSVAGNDDNNSGMSSASPWRTIARANTRDFNPGDRLLFRGGDTFNDVTLNLTSEDAGTSTNPITVTSYGSGRSRIDVPNNGSGIYGYNVAGIRISNLIVSGHWNSATQSGNDGKGIIFYMDE